MPRAVKEKPSAAELRKNLEQAERDGATKEELDKQFGKSRWFVSLQAPGIAEFRVEYSDEQGRLYMHLEADRWGVLCSRRTEAPFPDINERLELIKRGTAEITRLRVESVELPSVNRTATMTLICTKV